MAGYDFDSWRRAWPIRPSGRGWDYEGGDSHPKPGRVPGWRGGDGPTRWSAGGHAWPSSPPPRWRTGEPWGSGDSDVDRISVREIMTEAPAAVTRDTPLAEVAQLMRDLDVGVIPVVDDVDSYRLEGVITDRDIAVRAVARGENVKRAKAGDFMSRAVSTVRPNATIRDVFTVMKRERVRRVPVVEDDGKLVGIVAQADLAVDYAELRPDRELEVEEVLERISEPGRPAPLGRHGAGGDSSTDDPSSSHRFRYGWDIIKREARHLVHRGSRYRH